MANGWIEGTTVGSIILGVLLGGLLVSHNVSHALLGFDMPTIDTGINYAAGSRHLRHRGAVPHRRHHQLVHSRTPASITG